MDFTKFFEPVRGIVAYLVSRTGTIIITFVLLFINFDFQRQIESLYFYRDKYSSEIAGTIGQMSSDNKSIVVTIVSLLVFIGILEAHSSILSFLNRLSPFTFVGYRQDIDSLDFDIEFIWMCYCKNLDIHEMRKLHDIRKSVESAEDYSSPSDVFDYVSGWIFILLIGYFYLETRSIGILVFSLFILFMAGLFSTYRRMQYSSSGWEESRKAIFWLYENRLHDPQRLTENQARQLQSYRESRLRILRFSEPGVGIRLSWFEFIYRLITPVGLRDKVRQYKWRYENRLREALASLLGDGRSR